MHIAILTGPLLPVPAVQGGAVPRLWQGLAEVFVQRGHPVTLYCRSYPGQPAQETLKGVTYRRWGGFSQSRAVTRDLALDLIYSTGLMPQIHPADIVILNNFWLPALLPRLRPNIGRIVVNANRYPKGQYRFYGRVDRVAAASQAIAAAIVEQAPNLAGRVQVFANPLDTTVFSPPSAGRPPRDTKTLLYVGRLHPEKGVHRLLEAFQILSPRHPDLKLQIVGPSAEAQGGGGEQYLAQLKQLAAGRPVAFLPPVFDIHALAKIYQAADLFCYPSLAERGEAMPVAPLEAMATGLVPVVPNFACFADYIHPNQTGLVFDNQRSTPALVEVLDQALGNWPHTLSMGQQAYVKAQTFSYAAIAEQYLAVFTALLNP
ncbi:MAG: glycosyltransferase family 4 protein [Gloeomargaritaceae cyanobacterium C42_A2020_066]|nr:glycosyltransferase family 4 protein [Gloeomargaritaceae cyanobacterium C42_A2020_066]